MVTLVRRLVLGLVALVAALGVALVVSAVAVAAWDTWRERNGTRFVFPGPEQWPEREEASW